MVFRQVKISEMPVANPLIGEELIEVVQEGINKKILVSALFLPGLTGKSAYDVAVDNGFQGTQYEWLISIKGGQGVAGKAAYLSARDNGFAGTEAEWIASLKGTDGTDGVDGIGIDGQDGTGVPLGGTAGQILSKIDETDFNAEWIDAPTAVIEAVRAHYHQIPYDVAFGALGDYTKSTSLNKPVGIFASVREVRMPGDYVDAIALHRGIVDLSVTMEECYFSLLLNTVEIGRVTFTNKAYVGIITSSNGGDPVFLERGDVLELISPVATNTFCKDIAVTIVCCSIATDCGDIIEPA